MNLQVYQTEAGTIKYPQHKHDYWEIVLYLSGKGYLYTAKENIPFTHGTIILIPPGVVHGSVSENGFVNISIGGDFNNLLSFDNTVILSDNDEKEGESLALLLYKNRTSNDLYKNRLGEAFVYFLLKKIDAENPINIAVTKIISDISGNCTDCEFKVSNSLSACGYSEDYIRQQFKKITGMHPTEFLHKVRIEKAQFMIDIYAKTLSLSEIAEKCGYSDYVYFSKTFKKHIGISPICYMKSVLVR